MTTLNEQLVMVAEYMGYEIIPPRHYNEMNPRLVYVGHMDTYGTVNNLMSENDLKYHTSIEWLWTVAAKICNEEDRCIEWSCIEERRGKEESVRSIRLAATTFDIFTLFPAVVWAIRLINEYKTKDK